MNYYTYELQIGVTIIAEENNAITEITVDFSTEIPNREGSRIETDMIRLAAKQLDEYLSRQRRRFDLPLSPIQLRL